MLIYPQLSSGAMSQYPAGKGRRCRTVVNRAADGSSVRLADPNGEVMEWQLAYRDLSDAEAAALAQFFSSAEGSLNGFTFLDPTGNLLAWSEDFPNAVWQKGPLLTISGGVADPVGGAGAGRLVNGGAGPQSIVQTLTVPGQYLYCLSAYVRSAVPTTVTMILGGSRVERAASPAWTRIVFSAAGNAGVQPVDFGLEMPAGSTVEVYGIQAEPQAGASGYKPSTTGGVYENARLRDDALTITATGVNRNSCLVNIIHANHL